MQVPERRRLEVRSALVRLQKLELAARDLNHRSRDEVPSPAGDDFRSPASAFFSGPYDDSPCLAREPSAREETFATCGPSEVSIHQSRGRRGALVRGAGARLPDGAPRAVEELTAWQAAVLHLKTTQREGARGHHSIFAAYNFCSALQHYETSRPFHEETQRWERTVGSKIEMESSTR